MGLVRVPPSEAPEVVSVLSEAFFDYPVMRFVVGAAEPYAEHLLRLVGFFVAARYAREEVVLGVDREGVLDGVALVSRPAGGTTAPWLAEKREALWAVLGDDARARYEAFGAAAEAFEVDHPHLHLNMIGVRDGARGRGVGRQLLEAVHRLSAEDPESEGVSLSTEVAENVDLYRRFGYRVIGEARVDGAFTSWGMLRLDA